MFSKIRAVAIAIALSAAALFSTGADIALADPTNCGDILSLNNYFSGSNYDLAATMRSSRATLDLNSGFAPCLNEPATDIGAGSSIWTAITPGTGSSQFGNPDAIVQVGIIDCDHAWDISTTPVC